MILFENRKVKNNIQDSSINKTSTAYINKFESAVKNFEIMIEEERMKKNMHLKSRYASFN